MKHLKTTVLFALPTLLIACGGGSTGPTYGTDVTLAPSSGAGSGYLTTDEIADLNDAFSALSDAIYDNNAYAMVDGAGSVDMTGFMGFSEDGNEDEVIIGNMSVSIDYDLASVTGSAADFGVFDLSGETPSQVIDVTGTLSISGSAAGSGIAMDAIGNLSDGVDTFAVDLDLGGDLYDVDGTNTYLGNGTGAYTSAGGSSNLTADFVLQD